MTIEQAIKILSACEKGTWPIPHPDRNDALKLGIEALKAVKFSRENPHPIRIVYLAGETE